MRKLAVVALITLTSALAREGASNSARAADSVDPMQVLARVADRNPSLHTYSCRMHVEVRLRSFPFVRQHLDGTMYFRRPGDLGVAFDRVPSYARGFDKVYTDAGDPTNWPRQFKITVEGESHVDRHRVIALRLVERKAGRIDHEDVTIDPDRRTIDSIAYHYDNGGTITMMQRYASVDGYTVLAAQHADIHVPSIRAVADSTYEAYRPNVPVDASVFAKGK